jgi:hypothetical protein
VPTYAVNQDAVRYAKRPIDARQYVLRSRWQERQPRALAAPFVEVPKRLLEALRLEIPERAGLHATGTAPTPDRPGS